MTFRKKKTPRSVPVDYSIKRKRWHGKKNKVQLQGKSKALKIKKIVSKKGCHCFFCGNSVDYSKITVEHLHPRSKGGTNHISNLEIAHSYCNSFVGSLSVSHKLKLKAAWGNRKEIRKRLVGF